ncbi:mannitol-1-phosphate 5-dehydrogenase [Cohnella hashimotonis]|uniref:Mannitol-1-phosphate 5-dehydrogenase n=1 Tax=Cohnella hashimotonis TaxID=2826895 RepID=A0ABT6TRE2_9BACL|nr:mannitol-1-phosphate 5-dehydrogenase [Cohnella hashimotonis]MDI4648895.1 mannitol-1-phosphate 5-dehydrogenase [Cohnella hashimotonis]
MKALHFGAGNIGRGFIGLLLSRAGYEVVFSDVNKTLVDALRERGEYTVTLADDKQERIRVAGVTAIDGTDLAAVASAVAEADLVTTAVGVNILKHIAPGLARGIERRIAAGAGPLHLIACENAIGGSAQLKAHVYGHLDEETRRGADAVCAFPNAAVDRIVPIQHNEDPLAVTVEPFYEWAVDASVMFPDFKRIEGVHYVNDLTPYIERKLFTVNTGHASAAYLGNLKGYETIQQAMADDALVGEVRAVLDETGAVIVRKHGFDPEAHRHYIDTILGRFRNPNLTDEIARVGRSPIRKLSPNDRLVGPALLALEQGNEPDALAKVMAAALRFDYPDDPESAELQRSLADRGAGATLAKYTTLPPEHPLLLLALKQFEALAAELQS